MTAKQTLGCAPVCNEHAAQHADQCRTSTAEECPFISKTYFFEILSVLQTFHPQVILASILNITQSTKLVHFNCLLNVTTPGIKN